MSKKGCSGKCPHDFSLLNWCVCAAPPLKLIDLPGLDSPASDESLVRKPPACLFTCLMVLRHSCHPHFSIHLWQSLFRHEGSSCFFTVHILLISLLVIVQSPGQCNACFVSSGIIHGCWVCFFSDPSCMFSIFRSITLLKTPMPYSLL